MQAKDTVSADQKAGVAKEEPAKYHPRALGYFIDGVIAEMTGDATGAVIYYETARRFDTASETIHASLAGVYVDIGDLDRAEKALNRLVAHSPRNIGLLESQADLYLQKRDYSRAIEIWETVCLIDPSRLESRFKLIALYELQGKWNEMAHHYEIILRDHQDNIMVSVKLGSLYLKLKAYDQAEEVYHKALLYDPNNLYLLEAMASAQLAKKDYLSALATYEGILRMKPGDRIVHHRIASLALQTADYEKSLKHYRMIEKESGDQYDVQRGIGFALYQLKKIQESVPYFEKAVMLYDKDVLSMTLLAGIFQDRGDFTRSDHYFDKVLAVEPDNDLILNNFSYSLADRGVQLEKAQKMIRRALDKSPDNPHYLDTQGWIFFQQRQYDPALKYIKCSYDLDSTNWEVSEHMGDVHEKTGQTEKALRYFQRALELGGTADRIKSKIEKLLKEYPDEK